MSATNTLTYEVDVANDHKLQIDLPTDISGKVKVTVTPEQDAEKSIHEKNVDDFISFLDNLPEPENPISIEEAVAIVREERDSWE